MLPVNKSNYRCPGANATLCGFPLVTARRNPSGREQKNDKDKGVKGSDRKGEKHPKMLHLCRRCGRLSACTGAIAICIAGSGDAVARFFFTFANH